MLIPINIIQTYQYKEYILHWIDMDKEKYWQVFLKTDDKYKGLLWKKKEDSSEYEIIQTLKMGDVNLKANESKVLFNLTTDSLKSFKETSLIQVSFNNNFNSENNKK